jgi:capsular polysaccharide transport system permease protein
MITKRKNDLHTRKTCLKHRNALRVFSSVIGALFYRELGVRISEGRTGLFWAFFEPFIQIMIFVAIKVILFSSSAGNFDYVAFLSLNFLAFNLFKNIVNKSANAFRQNKALFIYKQVKPIDTVIARALLEMFITAILLLIFILLGYYLDHDLHVKNLNAVALGFIWLIVFALGVGLLNATINAFSPNFGKLVSFMMTPLMFGSAVIYTLDATPMGFKDLLLINPLTHLMEIIHGFYFYALDDRYVDYGYAGFWTLSILFIGLWIYRFFEERIISAL